MSVLSEAMQAEYWERGWTVAPGALSSDLVESLRQLAQEVWDRAVADPDCADRLFLRQSDGGVRVPDRIDPFLDLHPELTALSDHPELRAPTEALLGGPVWVLKDKLIRKQPGADGYGAHQDQAYYDATGIAAERLVSVGVPLASADRDAGPLEVGAELPDGLVSAAGQLDPDPSTLTMGWQEVLLEPGDLLFLHPLALHRSAPNRSALDRPFVYVTYGTGPGGAVAARLIRELYIQTRKADIDAGGTGRISRPSGSPPDREPPPPPV